MKNLDEKNEMVARIKNDIYFSVISNKDAYPETIHLALRELAEYCEREAWKTPVHLK